MTSDQGRDQIARYPGMFWFVLLQAEGDGRAEATWYGSTEGLMQLLRPFRVEAGPFGTEEEAENAHENYWWVPPAEDD